MKTPQASTEERASGSGSAPGVMIPTAGHKGAPVTTVEKGSVVWGVAQALALGLILVGGADLALLWYPAQFGSPEFEFATIGRFASGMPVVTMGIGLLALVGVAGERRFAAWASFLLAALFAAVLTVLLIVFITDIPIALRVNAEPAIRTGIKKVIVKALFELGVYWVLTGYIAMRMFRVARSG